ncbi:MULTISPECIES: hypothetical protein [Colwellia]|nr:MULTISPECIES: hypothetical protein [Colwellia]
MIILQIKPIYPCDKFISLKNKDFICWQHSCKANGKSKRVLDAIEQD